MKRIPGMLLLTFLLSTTLVAAGPWGPGMPYQNEWSFGVGGFEPRGSSDLWEQNERDFTFDPDDMADFTLTASVGTMINNFVAVDANLSWYDGDTDSADRNFVTTNGGPIEHETSLILVPLSADVRIMPFGFYRRDTQHLPYRVVPYIGGGVGAVYYKYEESGDFVNPSLQTIFTADFSSSGVTPEYHGFIGLDVMLSPQVSLYIEGRATRAEDDLDSDFEGFDELDLSGESLTVGTRIRW